MNFLLTISDSFIVGEWAYYIDRSERWLRRDENAKLWQARDRVRAASRDLWEEL